MIVDIHNHILPGLDDGPKNWEDTLLLAKQAVKTGITHIFATPHHKHQHKDHFYENEAKTILNLTHKLNTFLTQNQIPLTIHPGIEFHVHKGILDDLVKRPDDFLTLNNTGKHMLIELPCHYLPEHTEEVLSRLQKRGFIPVIAHPERNRVLRNNPSLIYKWVQGGALVQVTAGSITGIHGKRLKNFSLHLLDHYLVHFIASDAHHHTRRKFELIPALNYINENYSKDYRNYLEINAVHIINGTEFRIVDPKIIGKRRQYFFLYNHPLNKIKESVE